MAAKRFDLSTIDKYSSEAVNEQVDMLQNTLATRFPGFEENIDELLTRFRGDVQNMVREFFPECLKNRIVEIKNINNTGKTMRGVIEDIAVVEADDVQTTYLIFNTVDPDEDNMALKPLHIKVIWEKCRLFRSGNVTALSIPKEFIDECHIGRINVLAKDKNEWRWKSDARS